MDPINIVVIVAIVVTGGVLIAPPIAGKTLWRATTTPLASIIGSGFLVLGPILSASFGMYAPIAMAGLCGLAYAFGWAIRTNIASLDRLGDERPKHEDKIDDASSWVLAFAYFISVAYYLNLFGAFAVSLTPFDSKWAAEIVTSVVFVIILAVGWSKGFAALEGLERVSVGIKLAIITGLIAGLALFANQEIGTNGPILAPLTVTGWSAITLGFGLIVTVQGFETSRYLGRTYDASTRIRSMRLAQLLASGIYMVYILLMAYSFAPITGELSETEIIDMMHVVTPLLPIFLVVAALSAQFSAAIADTGGSGGLIHELSDKRMSPRHAYLLLVIVGLGLTWFADIFQIIAYASRSFALYYAIQAGLAAIITLRRDGKSGWRFLMLTCLSGLGVAIAVFGTSVE